jgi:hypothetical protein
LCSTLKSYFISRKGIMTAKGRVRLTMQHFGLSFAHKSTCYNQRYMVGLISNIIIFKFIHHN